MSERLRVLLADDEPLALERLVAAFGDIEDAEIVGKASNGVEAGEMIAALKPDVAVLDIQMPGRTGLGIAAALDPAERPEIIFLTAYEHHAVDAFDVDAADYVLKPLRLDRLRRAIERVRRRRSDRSAEASNSVADTADADAFWVQGRHGLVRVDFAEIDWVEAAKDYVLLHTPMRSHILRTTMGTIEARVDPSALLRVHRSAFVRPGAVRSLQRTAAGGAALVLADNVAIPVGPSYLPEVEQRFGT